MSISYIKNPNPTQLQMQQSNYRFKNNSENIFPIYNINEIWKPIILPILKNWYYISSFGRVYSKLYDCIIRQRFVGRGYKIVTLRTIDNSPIDLLIHRLVMITFNPINNSNEFQVNHKDTNKTNNHLYNLEWCTNSENMIHAYNHNLYKQGEDNNFAIISNITATKICEGLQLKMSYDNICKYCNLPNTKRYKNIICQIKLHNNWKSISKNYNF